MRQIFQRLQNFYEEHAIQATLLMLAVGGLAFAGAARLFSPVYVTGGISNDFFESSLLAGVLELLGLGFVLSATQVVELPRLGLWEGLTNFGFILTHWAIALALLGIANRVRLWLTTFLNERPMVFFITVSGIAAAIATFKGVLAAPYWLLVVPMVLFILALLLPFYVLLETLVILLQRGDLLYYAPWLALLLLLIVLAVIQSIRYHTAQQRYRAFGSARSSSAPTDRNRLTGAEEEWVVDYVADGLRSRFGRTTYVAESGGGYMAGPDGEVITHAAWREEEEKLRSQARVRFE